MHTRLAHSHRSFGTLLCMVLAMVFAAMTLSSTLDRMQHAPGAPAQHEHMIFGDLSVGEIDADDHHDTPGNDDTTGHLAGGHQHHSDGGSSLLAQAPADVAPLNWAMRPQPREPRAPLAGPRVAGPEKPPKA